MESLAKSFNDTILLSYLLFTLDHLVSKTFIERIQPFKLFRHILIVFPKLFK